MTDTRESAMALRLEGLTYAQIGTRLGISRQRAQQLAPAHLSQSVIRKLMADSRELAALKKELGI